MRCSNLVTVKLCIMLHATHQDPDFSLFTSLTLIWNHGILIWTVPTFCSFLSQCSDPQTARRPEQSFSSQCRSCVTITRFLVWMTLKKSVCWRKTVTQLFNAAFTWIQADSRQHPLNSTGREIQTHDVTECQDGKTKTSMMTCCYGDVLFTKEGIEYNKSYYFMYVILCNYSSNAWSV